MIKKVLLSAKLDKDPSIAIEQLKRLRYPVMCSTKIDGIRMHVEPPTISDFPVCLTRKNKLIPNHFIRKETSRYSFIFLDGEVTVGKPNRNNLYNDVQSAVMSQLGEPDFRFRIFDRVDESGRIPFHERYAAIEQMATNQLFKSSRIYVVPHVYIYSYDELVAYEEDAVSKGWEGIMIRDPYGIYKQGRSTINEGILIKVKRFIDGEAEILGCYEQNTNTNLAVISETGNMKRNKQKAGMIANGHIGGFHVKDIETGVQFDIGNLSGITKEQRRLLWQGFCADPSMLLNKTVKYKHFPIGQKDKPRQPILLGFRDQIDMGE